MIPLPRWADRALDVRLTPPTTLVHGPADSPGSAQSLLLACQQIALQSIYWLIPGLAAAAFGLNGPQLMGFVCVTLACNALGAVLHGLRRGPVGSGYGLPNIPTPIFMSAYLASAASGTTLAGAGAALVLAALLGLLLFCLFPRMLNLIPPEMTGVVVLMIGASLLPKSGELLARDTLRGLAGGPAVILMLGSLALMVVATTIRWPLARFAVIIGGGCGTIIASAMGSDVPPPTSVAATYEWFALPTPVLPDFGAMTWGLFLAFFISINCCVPSWLGDMLTYQRGIGANWVRPDLAPLRRGVVSGFLANICCGLFGGYATCPSSACVGLSVATRSFSRRVVMVAAAILLLVSCSPRLVAAVVQIPGPVAAAMLIFVSSSMLAGGATLIATRVLDARRSACVGLGMAAGLMALGFKEPLSHYLSGELLTPVTLAFSTAFALHLCTLPLVSRRLEVSLDITRRPGDDIDIFVERAAGAWSLQRRTADAIAHSTLEVCEILARRGIDSVQVRMRATDGVVRVRIRHSGPALPFPARSPQAEDLGGNVQQRESFSMWLAARDAIDFRVHQLRRYSSVELEYRD